MNQKETMRFDTKAVHAGEPRPLVERALVQPIYQSSTFEYGGEANYDDIRYIRLNNTPNHRLLADKIAALEGAEAGMVTSSGMSVISTALLALVGEGEHLLVQDDLYGGTHHFLKDNFPKLARSVSFFPLAEIGNLQKWMTPKTRAVYVESISNPLLKIPDLEAVARFAKQHGLISLIDNTFPSPVNFTPTAMGFDFVLHSATKYLNGHSDIVAGAAAGRRELIQKVMPLLNHLGGSMDPHTCFLLNRGLKTLGVRVRQQNQSAMKLAEELEKSPRIKKVFYPGLKSHPDHARAREWMRGYGGMISFEYDGDAKSTDQMLRRLKIPCIAPSLGGVETLITRPATTSHSGVSPDDRRKLGIGDNLVRVSVGLEDIEDLLEDFRGACK